MSAPLRQQFKDEKFRYDVFLYSTYHSQEVITTAAKKQPFSKEGGSLEKYTLESRFGSWELAKDEISAVWIVYSDEGETEVWRGQVKEMFEQGSDQWNIPNIKKHTNAVSKTSNKEPNTQKAQITNIKFSLYARKAASFGYGQTQLGSIGGLVSPTKPSLHFTLMIEDLYYGVWGTDGQPSGMMNQKLNVSFYNNVYPKFIILKININPPGGMSREEFKKRLMKNAYNFRELYT